MDAPKRRSPLHLIIPVIVLFAAAFIVFARTMDRDLNHDEHQFLAPGYLLAHQGAQPYRDYPLFHLPNLVLVYAAVSRCTDHYVIGAKLVSFVGTLALLSVLVLRGARHFPFQSSKWAIPIAIAVPTLLLTDPLFLWTAGKTWNHELPVGAIALGYLALLAAFDRTSWILSALSAALISFAIGCRLTLLPVVAPFLFAFVLVPGIDRKQKFQLFVAFAVAGIAAGAPSLYYFFTAHDAFIFGNLEFPRIRLVDPSDTRAAETAAWWRKVRYFFKEVALLDHRKDGQFQGSLLLFLAFLAVAVPPAWHWLRKPKADSGEMDRRNFAPALATLLVPFAILGCGLPTRYQYQHWFAVVPFLALAIVEALPFVGIGRVQWRPIALTLLAFVGLILGARAYVEPLSRVASPSEWFGNRLNGYAADISSHVPRGKILTLSPASAIEARAEIYPEFATGPFAWRLGHLVAPEKRQRFHLVAPADLPDFLAKDPPAAILTGVEDDELEKPLLDYAQAHNFERVRLAKRRDLWVSTRTGASLKQSTAPL